MIKINDTLFGIYYRKTYKDDKDIDVQAFIKGLYETNFEPIKVRLIEGVEMDMQSVNGDEYLISTFMEEYDDIKTMGHDLMYRLYGYLGDDYVIITLADDYPFITISTENPDIEIEDILEKVSEQSPQIK